MNNQNSNNNKRKRTSEGSQANQPPKKRQTVTAKRKSKTSSENNATVVRDGASGKQRANALIQSLFPTGNSNSTGLGRYSRLVCEDEVIVPNVNMTSTFANAQYSIQPGDSFFPWLSLQAIQYQRYRIRKMCFYYRGYVTVTNPVGLAGKVILSCNYNALAPTPTSRTQVEDTVPHSDGMPFESIFLHLDPSQLTPKPKFIRGNQLPAGGDITNFDAGVVNVSTDAGNAAGGVLPAPSGELRCKYEIELIDPVVQATQGTVATASPFQYFHMFSNLQTFADSVIQPMTGTWTALSTNSGVTFIPGTGTFSLPRGNWLITMSSVVDATGGQQLINGYIDIYNNGLSIFGGPNGLVAQFGSTPVSGIYPILYTTLVATATVSSSGTGILSQFSPYCFMNTTASSTYSIVTKITCLNLP